MHVRRACLALPLLAALLAAGGCTPKAHTFAPYCPEARRLPEGQRLTAYREGGGRDITDMVLQGEITDVTGTCVDGDKDNTVDVTATVFFRFLRGPAMRDRQVVVPYLFTLAKGGDIREQARFGIAVSFPPNVDSVTVSSEPIHMVFPVSRDTSAADYTIFATFALTPEQLEHNRMTQTR